MSLRKEIIAVLDNLAQSELEYITINHLMNGLPAGTDLHSVQTQVSKIARDGLLGKGEPKGPGSGGSRKYKLIKETKEKKIIEVAEKDTDPDISFDQLGEAMYIKLVTLERKLREANDKLRDAEYKLKEDRQDHTRSLKKLNATITEQNSTIAGLRNRVGHSGSKTFKMSEVIHTSESQKKSS